MTAIRARSLLQLPMALLALLCLTAAGQPGFAAASDTDDSPLSWPEAQRSFWYDGPSFLLTSQQRRELRAMDEVQRSQWIDEFLGRDPIPETPENELQEGIRRRKELLKRNFVSLLDERAKLLFLNGTPDDHIFVDCDQTFVPLEIWGYGPAEALRQFVVYQPRGGGQYRLWLPLDSKRVLYAREMEYWLEQFEELRSQIRGRRFDYQLCKQAKLVDKVTGVSGLFGFEENRPTNADLLPLIQAPEDLAKWAAAAARTPDSGDLAAPLQVEGVEVLYPKKDGQRLVARITVTLSPTAGLDRYKDPVDEREEYRVNVEGVFETGEEIFDDFKVRFQVPLEEGETRPVALVVEKAIRPGSEFLLRLRVRDEVGGGVADLTQGIEVPRQPTPIDLPESDDEMVVAMASAVARDGVSGVDSLILVPPETDLVLGLWRAEAMVTGSKITQVRFVLDGEVQMTRGRPPYTAELRLSEYPTEQVVRIEGYDNEDQLVAFDEVVINQQRGELRLEIIHPPAGKVTVGKVTAEVNIVVPEERTVTRVDFSVNDELMVTRTAPPWKADLDVPRSVSAQDVSYLTVVAELDDGSRAESVRFLNQPDFVEQVEVDLVELYTAVTDKSNQPINTLSESDFEVFEDGRPQEISRFELVEDRPITIGITIDTSGSMIESLGEAKRAASEFLDSIAGPDDQTFAVSFSNRPGLIMHRTSDHSAVQQALQGLSANGMTSLYDAVVTSLYYFRGVRGRRALILLSDGEDTSSTFDFQPTMKYARQSGVAIYTIGLEIGKLQTGVRGKLRDLATETGGRSFFISNANELRTVYAEIERELRSQYLLAYNSDRPPGEGDRGAFRTVEVKVKNGLVARTISGYYP
jgi:Ca-activated chloride channel family protein